MNNTGAVMMAIKQRSYKDEYFKSLESLDKSIDNAGKLTGAAAGAVGAGLIGAAALGASALKGKKGARFGGMFSGPQEGYDVTLHGNEAVIPLQTNTQSKIPLDAPLTQLPGMPGSNLIKKMDELIEVVRTHMGGNQVGDSSTLTSLNNVNGGTKVTNIYQSGSERDIPFVERNKFRQKLIYARGLL